MKTRKKGLIFVVSGPSGSGKTTLTKKLLKSMRRLKYSVSATTRAPRRGEIDGVNYFFLDEKTFRKMVKKHLFAEWAVVHGHYYGTPKKYLRDTLNKGYSLLLDIDVQGSRKIRKEYGNGIFIFILPPSIATLEKRLRSRAQDKESIIRTRLKNALKEIKELYIYDHIIVNDDLNKALANLRSIIKNRLKN